MKISRYKKVQKNLNFFVNNFGFRKPYQILIDGTFAFGALQNKLNIQDQLPKYFQSQVKLLTTQCVILETEMLGPKVFGAMVIVKQFALHKCGHEKKPVSGSKCLRSMLGKDNSSRYIIATQDHDLQENVRKVPGVPLIYLHGKAPTLESPSTASQKRAEELRRTVGLNTMQQEVIVSLKKQSGLADEHEIKSKKKKKKGGPNPLSCKKKKITAPLAVNKMGAGNVRKRKRVKLPEHVKEILRTEKSILTGTVHKEH